MTTLQIPAMACEHCVKKISAVIAACTSDFSINLSQKTVQLTVTKEILMSIIETLKETGYVVSSIIDG